MNSSTSALRFFFKLALGRADLVTQRARVHHPLKSIAAAVEARGNIPIRQVMGVARYLSQPALSEVPGRAGTRTDGTSISSSRCRAESPISPVRTRRGMVMFADIYIIYRDAWRRGTCRCLA
jgi:hypothetical protein